MAIYEDFVLDVTAGTNVAGNNSVNGSANCNTMAPCYTDGDCKPLTTYTTKGDTCDCTGDTCTGMSPRPCDR